MKYFIILFVTALFTATVSHAKPITIKGTLNPIMTVGSEGPGCQLTQKNGKAIEIDLSNTSVDCSPGLTVIATGEFQVINGIERHSYRVFIATAAYSSPN